LRSASARPLRSLHAAWQRETEPAREGAWVVFTQSSPGGGGGPPAKPVVVGISRPRGARGKSPPTAAARPPPPRTGRNWEPSDLRVALGRSGGLQRGDPRFQLRVVFARAAGHVLHRVEFLAADEIDAAKRFLHAFARAVARFAGHARQRACGRVGQFNEVGDQGSFALHRAYVAGS